MVRLLIRSMVLGLSALSGYSQTTTTRQTSPTRQALIPPPKRNVPGTRMPITSGTVYVPDDFRPADATGTHMLLFFHGASWVAEQNFHDARKNAVLVSVSMPMDRYAPAMSQPGAMERLVGQVEHALAAANITSAPVTRICLSSFSGGYGAVREILRGRERYGIVTDVVLADSLYGPRVPGNDTALVTTATQPFLDFAREAATPGSDKHFLFSHLFPPEEQHRGNTTTVAAYYLSDQLGVSRTPATASNSRGAKLLYRADRHNFHVLGYAGMTTQDHFEHFYAIGDLWKLTSLQNAKP